MNVAPVQMQPVIQENVDRFQSWCKELPSSRWLLYRNVMSEATRREIPFAIGGGLASMVYAGQLRDTKDIDLYVQPEHREAMMQVAVEAGLADYHERVPYDRNWIFRGFREDLIVDVMWAMANQRAQVDREWLTGPPVSVDGLTFRLLRPEETLWSKLYVLQRDRCDWPDVLNVLHCVGPVLDWMHLFHRTGEDTPLLGALVAVFRWMCPERYEEFPPIVSQRLGLTEEPSGKADWRNRARLLDGRPWFVPTFDKKALAKTQE